MAKIIVQLTIAEVTASALTGVLRQIAALQAGLPQGDGPDQPWQANLEGALAERAWAKHRRVYYDSAVTAHADPTSYDVYDPDAPGGVGWEVRAKFRVGDPLILRPRDKDDRPYVLLVGRNGRYEVAGWIMGGVGKTSVPLSNPTSKPGRALAHFVPQSMLTPYEGRQADLDSPGERASISG